MTEESHHTERSEALVQGLEELKAHLQRGNRLPNTESVRRRVVDIAGLRRRHGMTQQQFASAFGIALGTLRNWEQGRRIPDGPAQRLLEIIEDRPDVAAEVLGRDDGGAGNDRPVRRAGRAGRPAALRAGRVR